MERRLPIIVVVRLGQAEPVGTHIEERTYTDNISAHGARVFSRHPRKIGGEVLLTPKNEETARGNVVYCQRLADDRYGVGVRFQDRPVTWSIMRRFDGMQISSLAKIEFS